MPHIDPRSPLLPSVQNLCAVVRDLADAAHHLNGLTAIGTRLDPPVTRAETAELGGRFIEGLIGSYIVCTEAAVAELRTHMAERPDWPEAHDNLTQLRRCMSEYHAVLLRLHGFPADLAERVRKSLAEIDAIPPF